MNADRLLAHYEEIADAPDAIPHLRRFVLDLAVRGKLVSQDPSDGSAADLLEHIAKIKGNGDSQKSIRGEFPVPSSWRWSTIGYLATKTGSGSTPKGGKQVYRQNGIPFLRSQNVYNDGLRLQDVAYIDQHTHERMKGTAVSPGDLLLNITGGSIGRCCLVAGEPILANISQHVAIIRPAIQKMGLYLHLAVMSPFFQNHVYGEQTGAGRGGLPKNRMDRIEIPIPPLAEQNRIVTTVDELMRLCDRLEVSRKEREERRSRLTTASFARLRSPGSSTSQRDARFVLDSLRVLTSRPDQIGVLRQVILNLAVHGVLVAQDPKDRSASELIKRFKDEISAYANAQKISVTQVAPIVDAEMSFVAPPGWRWTRLCELFKVITDGDHQPPPKSDQGVAFLTIGNITTGRLDFTDCRWVCEEYYRSLPTYRTPARGDILYTVVGATYGRPALVKTDRNFCVQRHIAILKPCESLELRFLMILLASPLVYDQASKSTTGTAQPTIPLRPLRNFVVPLPPKEEQHRIVARTDQLMALCDQLERSLTAADVTRNRLLNSLLAEALEDSSDAIAA